MRQQNLSLENQIDFLFWFREKLKQMTLEEQIQYWVDIAESDVPVAKNLFENGHFIYCLFFGHLILEKIIKAHYVKDTQQTPPKIHDLVSLERRTKLNLSKEQREFLLKVNNFNLESRYPDFKRNAFVVATKAYTEDYMKKIMEMYEWLKNKI
ncbi:MAG: HEPN domain-containing protein [Bacteroidetes bacterium]|nr:HEPN domain-containing protein [Bacteroidota bacterium]MCL6099626.1 HEPN domain-containing protein [Bacteroidota bacterium]